MGSYSNDYYGEAKVMIKDGGLALVLGPDQLTLSLTHVDANTFTMQLFPESPQDHYAVTFAVPDGGKATAVDIGEDDGPQTGQLTRVH